MLNKDSFIKLMHMAASVRRPVPYTINSTAQLIENENNSQVGYRIQISNLQTKHILTSQSYWCVAKRNSTLYCDGHNHKQNNFQWKSRLLFFPGDPIILATTKNGSTYEI